MNQLKLDKGFIIPLRLLNNKKLKNLNEIVLLTVIIPFKPNKFSSDEKEEVIKPPYFINREEIYNLVPFDKRTINKILDYLVNINYITYNSFTKDYSNYVYYSEKYKEEGFLFVPIEIFYNKDLNLLDKILLSYIRGYTLQNRNFNVTTTNLCSLLKTTKASILRSLNKLQDLNFINRNREGRSRVLMANLVNIQAYFKNADIREIKEIKNVNVDNLKIEHQTNIYNIVNVNNLNELKLTKEQQTKLFDIINNENATNDS